MCARVQSDVMRVVRVLRGPVFQFCTCLWRHVFVMLRVLCVLLGLSVLYALCALYPFSKPYVQHRGPQKRASGQKRTDGSQRNIYVCIYIYMSLCVCVWVGGETTKWPNAAEGETVAAFLCLFGMHPKQTQKMSDPPQRKNYFC